MSGFFDTLRPREFSWQFKDQPKVKPLKQYPPFPGDSMVRNGDLMGYLIGMYIINGSSLGYQWDVHRFSNDIAGYIMGYN